VNHGFADDGWVPTVDFEYPEDEAAEAPTPEPLHELKTAMRSVLAWCMEPDSWRTKQIRLAAACYVLDVFPGRPLREYGQSVRLNTSDKCEGVTRAAISAAAVEFCDRYHYQKPGMKTATARLNMAAARNRCVQYGPKTLSRRGRHLCAVVFLLREALRAKGAKNADLAAMLGVTKRGLRMWLSASREPTGVQAARIKELAEKYAGEIQRAKAQLANDPQAMLKLQILTAGPSEPASLN
jgi:predicted transcriptional regulator